MAVYPRNGYIEEFSSLNGHILCQMGFMSYSNALISRSDLEIGRCCSIAWGLNFIRTHHPLI
ncbi:hypothetical protein [Campylobacter sp. LR196d]|uniref:hypothetical protein n=1 Tax=Campylobacter sp. LR196d TaxID=2593543 RepID=UPI001681172F|nr:hypothetical protein [Campylobacter sp. LR196d]